MGNKVMKFSRCHNFWTKQWAADWLINQIPTEQLDGRKLVDPCCGPNRPFGNALRKCGYEVEEHDIAQDGVDFLKPGFGNRFPYPKGVVFISNFPFNIASKFARLILDNDCEAWAVISGISSVSHNCDRIIQIDNPAYHRARVYTDADDKPLNVNTCIMSAFVHYGPQSGDHLVRRASSNELKQEAGQKFLCRCDLSHIYGQMTQYYEFDFPVEHFTWEEQGRLMLANGEEIGEEHRAQEKK